MLYNNNDKSEQGEFVLINVAEQIVEQKVAELMQQTDMCRCDKCRLNACAIALNALPPHYVTTNRGELLAKVSASALDQQTEVIVEVTKALMKVKEHPMH